MFASDDGTFQMQCRVATSTLYAHYMYNMNIKTNIFVQRNNHKY